MNQPAEVPRAALPLPPGDRERIRAYGAGHPEEWGGLSIGPHERLQAWFTDPAAHETALRAVLEHPELVDFRIAPRSERARSAVRAEVDALLGAHAGSWYGVGDRVSTISVSLAGSATELAAELHRRFGGAVEITIASFKYPLEPGAQRREPPGGVVSTAELPGVTLSVELENDVAPSGGLFRGLAWASNSGPTTVQLHTAREIGGYILDEAGRALAGYFGFTFAAGRTLVIQPGQRKSVPFFVGMDSYDPRIGTVLPPGDFELVVVLPLGGRPREQLVSRPTRVTVTPAAT